MRYIRFSFMVGFLLIAAMVFCQETLVPNFVQTGTSNEELGNFETATLDFNGDGWLDLLEYHHPYPAQGKYRLMLGGPTGFQIGSFDWEIPAGHYTTRDGTIGDFNNDGADDLVFSNPDINNGTGAIEVYYGGANLPDAPAEELNGFNQNGRFGLRFDAAGDINGDGFDDLLVVTPQTPVVGLHYGTVHCFYGNATGLDLSNYDLITAFSPGNLSNARHVGDVNSDGFGDVLIHVGTINGDEFTELYLGSANGPITNQTTVVSEGFSHEDYAHEMGNAGDVNGDGFSDMYIAAPQRDALQNPYKGVIEIIYGSPLGNYGFEELHYFSDDFSGFQESVAGLGDFNDDGYADLAYTDFNNLYVQLGGQNGFSTTPNYQFKLPGITPLKVRPAGDINQDGFTDMVASSATALNYAGWVAVFDGQTSLRAAFTVDTATCLEGNILQFSDLSYGGILSSWLWDFGDGTTSTEQNPTHSYTNGGEYNVSLTVTSSRGHLDELAKDSLISVFEPLNGIYTLGGLGAFFPSIEVFNRHAKCGLSADATIRLADGVYDGKLELDHVPTNGHTLTIESQSGNRDLVRLNTLSVMGTDNLMLRNLSVSNLGADSASVDVISSSNLRFENCVFYALGSSSYPGLWLRQSENVVVKDCFFDNYIQQFPLDWIFTSIDADETNYLMLEGNAFTHNVDTVLLPGNYINVRNGHHIVFKNNDFYLNYMYLEGLDTVSFEDNHVDNSLIDFFTSNFLTFHRNSLEGKTLVSLGLVRGFSIIGNRFQDISNGIVIGGGEGVPENGFDLIANNVFGTGGTDTYYYTNTPYDFALGLEDTRNARVYHNSFFWNGEFYENPTVNPSKAILLYRTQNVEVKNNAFSAPSGTAIFNLQNQGLVSDYNAFDEGDFMYSDLVTTPPTTFVSLDDYRDETGLEAHSIVASINYLDPFDLRLDANTPALNDYAPPLPQVTTDADGNPRSITAADIGAYEFNAPSIHDLHSLNLLTDTLLVGDNLIRMVVRNQRAAVEDSIYLHYSVNDLPIVTELWTGSLAEGDSLDYTFNQSFNLPKGRICTLTTWVSLPGSAPDIHPDNDSLSRRILVPLAGNYTVGTPASDYPILQRSFFEVWEAGSTGDVVFDIAPGDYHDVLGYVNTYPKSTVGSITYRSATGIANDVHWEVFDFYLLKSYHFENLTLYPNGTGTGTPGVLVSGESVISFDGCRFIGTPTGDFYHQYGLYLVCVDTLLINNCSFQGFIRGIHVADVGSSCFEDGPRLLVVENSEFFDIVESAFHFYRYDWSPYMKFSNNYFHDLPKAIVFGTSNSSAPQLIISGNRFYASTAGVSLDNCFFEYGLYVHNNFFGENSFFNSYAAHTPFVMANNSFNIENGPCMQVISPWPMEFYNNSYAGKSGFGSPLVLISNNHPSNYISDNNNYYDTGEGKIFGTAIGTGVTTIAEIQALTGGHDQHSLVVQPGYVSATDLHLSPTSLLVDAGVTVQGVFDDIDGDSRPQTGFDIGADEHGSVNATQGRILPKGIEVFPNPAHDFLNIASQNGPIHSWRLFDMTGRMVSSGSSQQVEIATIAAGTYQLELELNGTLVRTFVIKD